MNVWLGDVPSRTGRWVGFWDRIHWSVVVGGLAAACDMVGVVCCVCVVASKWVSIVSFS